MRREPARLGQPQVEEWYMPSDPSPADLPSLEDILRRLEKSRANFRVLKEQYDAMMDEVEERRRKEDPNGP